MIQLFGRKKGHDTKKAERFLKERKLEFQFVDLDQKGMSKRELEDVLKTYSMGEILDVKTKEKEALALFEMASSERKLELLLEYPELLKVPILRDKPRVIVGVDEKKWKELL